MSMDVSEVLARLNVEYCALQARVEELSVENSHLSEQLLSRTDSLAEGAPQSAGPSNGEKDPALGRSSPSRLSPHRMPHAAVPPPLDNSLTKAGGGDDSSKRPSPQHSPGSPSRQPRPARPSMVSIDELNESKDCSEAKLGEAKLGETKLLEKGGREERSEWTPEPKLEPKLPGLLAKPAPRTLSSMTSHPSRRESGEVWNPNLHGSVRHARSSCGSLDSREAEENRADVLKRVTGRHTTLHHQLIKTFVDPRTVEGGRSASDSLQCRVLFVDSALAVLVVMNTITIGMSADMGEDSPKMWIGIDATFAFLFLCELIFKLYAFGPREYFCGNDGRWGLFEAGLVAFALLEVVLAVMKEIERAAQREAQQGGAGASLSLFRIVRLLRITRIVRLVRLDIFSELMVMIKGTLGGIRTLGWSILLVSVPLYVVALILRETLGEIEYSLREDRGAEQFGTVGESFFTVFRCVIAGECTEAQGRPIFLHVTKNFGWGYGALYCCTMVFMTFGLFNVIVAIFVENVIAGAKFNEHIKKQSRLRDRMLYLDKTAELVEIIAEEVGYGKHGSMTTGSMTNSMTTFDREQRREAMLQGIRELELTPQLFENLRKQERFQQLLRDLDIAEQDQFDLFETLDVDGSGTVDLDELLAGISKLRGDPRRSDIVAVSLLLRSVQAEIRANLKDLTQQLESTTEEIRNNGRALGKISQAQL